MVQGAWWGWGILQAVPRSWHSWQLGMEPSPLHAGRSLSRGGGKLGSVRTAPAGTVKCYRGGAIGNQQHPFPPPSPIPGSAPSPARPGVHTAPGAAAKHQQSVPMPP